MDNETINRRLAEALGWKNWHGMLPVIHLKLGEMEDFSPATSSDHLRMYVLPEVERRGLTHAMMYEFGKTVPGVHGFPWWDAWFALAKAGPTVLAAAALQALEGGE